jgi:hypothetical protein
VDPGSLLAATLTNRLEALVGLSLKARLVGIGQNLLMGNFDSTMGEIRCYTDSKHSRPLFEFFLIGKIDTLWRYQMSALF